MIDANKYPCNTCDISYCYKNCDKFNAWLEKTVDAMEVVHGRWKQARYTEAPLYICSECDKPEYKQHRYCPNCGAKMDGGIGNEIS